MLVGDQQGRGQNYMINAAKTKAHLTFNFSDIDGAK